MARGILLVKAALGVAGFGLFAVGGYNLMSTGCPLGSCGDSTQTQAVAATGDDCPLGCSGEKTGDCEGEASGECCSKGANVQAAAMSDLECSAHGADACPGMTAMSGCTGQTQSVAASGCTGQTQSVTASGCTGQTQSVTASGCTREQHTGTCTEGEKAACAEKAAAHEGCLEECDANCTEAEKAACAAGECPAECKERCEKEADAGNAAEPAESGNG